jgi:O-antigen ligase
MVYIFITRRRKYNKLIDKKAILPAISLLLFFVTAGISTLYAQYSITSFYYFVWLTKFVVLFFLAKVILADPKIARSTIEILVFFTLINCILIIGQFMVKGPLGTGLEDSFKPYGKYSEQNLFRPGGFTTDPNIAASMIAAVFPLVLAKTLTVAVSAYAVNWIVLIIFILGLIFTASRAAWGVAIVVACTLVFYLHKTKSIHIPPLIKKRWKLGLLILVLIAFPVIISRLSTIQQAFGWEGSGLYRFRQVSLGLRMMQKSLFGVGLGMFSHPITTFNFPERFQLPSDLPHNVFVQVGAETGIVGLTFFTIFIYLLIRNKLAKLKIDAKLFPTSVLLAFVSIFLSMMAYPWLMQPRIGWLFWILAAYIF